MNYRSVRLEVPGPVKWSRLEMCSSQQQDGSSCGIFVLMVSNRRDTVICTLVCLSGEGGAYFNRCAMLWTKVQGHIFQTNFSIPLGKFYTFNFAGSKFCIISILYVLLSEVATLDWLCYWTSTLKIRASVQ
jgi:hypothetical protein